MKSPTKNTGESPVEKSDKAKSIEPFSEEMKEMARSMYISGKEIKEILREIRLKTQRPIKTETIMGWAQRGNWTELRDEARQRALAKVIDEISSEKAGLTTAQINAYRKMWARGLSEIEAQTIFGGLDAAKMVDLGIKGERQIQMGVISVNFVNKLMQILLEEIADETILRKVGLRLKSLAGEMLESGLQKEE